MMRITVYISQRLHKRMKTYRAKSGKSISRIVKEAVEAYLAAKETQAEVSV